MGIRVSPKYTLHKPKERNYTHIERWQQKDNSKKIPVKDYSQWLMPSCLPEGN